MLTLGDASSSHFGVSPLQVLLKHSLLGSVPRLSGSVGLG
jgi:hypothetical protein